jgi:hypothetical protein
MKNQGEFIGAIALTFAIGGALIIGNAALATGMVAVGVKPDYPAVVSNVKPETAEQVIAPDSNTNAKTNTNTNEISTTMKTLPNGSTVIISNGEVTVGEPTNGNDTAVSFYYNSDSGAFDVIDRSDLLNRYIEGQPGDGDIEQEAAVSIALKSITDRYALKQATLDKFSITATYYSTYGDISGAVWCINLNPINASDFSEIGCYRAVLNAETGEVVQLLSAADGRG